MQQFNYVAEIFVLGGIGSAMVIAADLRSCRQPMRIMNSVWILTGLWASFFGLWAYYAFGRSKNCTLEERASPPESARGTSEADRMPGMTAEGAQMDDVIPGPGDGVDRMPGLKMSDSGPDGKMPGMDMSSEKSGKSMKMPSAKSTGDMDMAGMRGMRTDHMEMPGMNRIDMEMSGGDMAGMDMGPQRPKWQSVTLSTLHCGAGCTLADLIGEWFLFFVPVAIGGSLIAGSWVLDYILALIFGIGFQYAAIRGMERISPRRAVARAAKADILSLTAWQVGMYGWMAVVIFGFWHGVQPPRNTFYFWFMMQIAMACGFLVALPVNVLLIRAGIKKAM